MNYYIYKIVNRITGRFYIGCRQTIKEVHDDDYFGSGVALKATIKKYGHENFYKVVMCQCEDKSEMFEMENGMMPEELAFSNDTYNLHAGGKGGSLPGVKKGKYKKVRSDKGKKRGCSEKQKIALDKLAMSRKGVKLNLSEETLKKLSDAGKKGGRPKKSKAPGSPDASPN